MARFRYQRGDQPLENYTVEYGLGVGGFGEVYFAVSESGREVALKAVQNYEEIELRGIRHCMNLKSPHLVTIFDVKRNLRGDPFVVMEYVNGPCLRSLIDASPEGLGTDKAAFFLREIAKGLTYLHDAGVVHRDLKPHNVFYEDGYVKIGDYSLCKLISTTQHTGHTMTVGSVHYMAPEISKGRYDSSVDIYALGVMLYEMLTGKPPFAGESIGEILMKHLNEEPDVSMVQEPFRAVVKRALAKSPSERFASAAEMVEAVFGSESVQDSVVTFNPQELTMVAGKVAAEVQKIRAGGGGGFADSSQRFGDASAWKAGVAADSSPVDVADLPSRYMSAISESARASMGISERQVELAKSGSWTATDRMPWQLRYAFGAAVALVMAAFTTSLPFQDSDAFGAFVGVSIGLSLIAISIMRRIGLRHVPLRSRLLPRGLVLFSLVFAVPLAVGLIADEVDGYFGPRETLLFVVACLAPCILLNLHPLCHPRRPTRLRLFPVAIASMLGLWLSYSFDWIVLWPGRYFYLAPAAVAAGVVMGIQIVSPKHRLKAQVQK